MAAGRTFEPIATHTFTGSQTEITLSSLSQSYTHLFLLMSLQLPNEYADFYLRFNGDSGSNYANTRMGFSSSSRSSTRDNGADKLQIMYATYGSLTDSPNVAEVWIPHYTNTNMQKNIQSRSAGGRETGRASGFWNSTSAINSITLLNGSLTYAAGSTITVFGIAEA